MTEHGIRNDPILLIFRKGFILQQLGIRAATEFLAILANDRIDHCTSNQGGNHHRTGRVRQLGAEGPSQVQDGRLNFRTQEGRAIEDCPPNRCQTSSAIPVLSRRSWRTRWQGKRRG